MGLLSQGSPLNWEETKKYADHIRKHGIIQFLNIYNKVKERQKDVLKWGDEVRNEPTCGICCAALDSTLRRVLHEVIVAPSLK